MKPKQQFRPANLRALLSVLLVIIVVGGGAVFYWGLSIVRDYTVSVNERAIDAEASTKQVQELQALKSQLAQSDSLIAKADQLFATPASYQAQLLSDVKNYANAAGLTIANTSFGNPAEGGYSMTLSFKTPVSYSKLIAFLNNIEGNIPKLQVSEINLGHIDGGGADSVKAGNIKIDIAVR